MNATVSAREERVGEMAEWGGEEGGREGEEKRGGGGGEEGGKGKGGGEMGGRGVLEGGGGVEGGLGGRTRGYGRGYGGVKFVVSEFGVVTFPLHEVHHEVQHGGISLVQVAQALKQAHEAGSVILTENENERGDEVTLVT